MVNGKISSQNVVDAEMSAMNYTGGDDHAFCGLVLG
jgi:hypothetical protein